MTAAAMKTTSASSSETIIEPHRRQTSRNQRGKGAVIGPILCFGRVSSAGNQHTMSTLPPRSTTAHAVAHVGLGDGEPLVLLHGVGMRLEAWGPQLAALALTHRVIAVDLPGHGESRPLGAAATLMDFVDWAAMLLDDLGCDPANVAGHSMGALIALGLAVTRPAKVLRVALLNGVFRRTEEARRAVIARAAEIASGRFDCDTPVRRWFGDADSPARRATYEWLSGVDRHAYATAYGAFAHGDAVFAGRIGELAGPALFLTGEDDPNSTPAMSRAMAELAPRGHAVVVPGHRHMVGLTAPERVNEALEAWLAEPVN